jgi:hypothetical protein
VVDPGSKREVDWGAEVRILTDEVGLDDEDVADPAEPEVPKGCPGLKR